MLTTVHVSSIRKRFLQTRKWDRDTPTDTSPSPALPVLPASRATQEMHQADPRGGAPVCCE